MARTPPGPLRAGVGSLDSAAPSVLMSSTWGQACWAVPDDAIRIDPSKSVSTIDMGCHLVCQQGFTHYKGFAVVMQAT